MDPRGADDGLSVAPTVVRVPPTPRERAEVEPSFDLERSPVRIDHYVLLHKLGRGGMGTVYAAYDELLDRRVAIKLLNARASARASARMLREAQALARLSHPNVVRIHEVGRVDERPFIVMELIEGVTLGRWRTERERTRGEILEVFLAAGRGLAAAHAKGLIHRDFKPDNIMVRHDGQVLVMDFGLAREGRTDAPNDDDGASESLDEPSSDSRPSPGAEPSPVSELASLRSRHPLTAVGAIMGTPGYMAPEQLFGEPISERADQFAFCAALWEALYDRRPFRGGDVHTYARSLMRGELRPSESGEVPTWLRKIVERGLAREPAGRWPSIEALLEALAHDPTRRRRRRYAVAGSLALAAAGLVGWWGVEQHRGERAARLRAEQIAACEREGRSIAEDWNDAVATRLERAFADTNSGIAESIWQHTRPWLDRYAREWAELRTETCIAAEVEGSRDPETTAARIDCLDEGRLGFAGSIATLLELGADDLPLLGSATTAAVQLPPPSVCSNPALLRHRRRSPIELRDEVGGLRARLERARARKFVGDHERALHEALAVRERAEALGWAPLLVAAGVEASDAYVKLGKPEDARRAAEQALWVASASDDELSLLLATNQTVEVLGPHLQQFEEAQGWATVSEAIIDRLGLRGTSHEAELLSNLGVMARQRGRLDESIAYHDRAVAVREAELGPLHPLVGVALIDRCGALGLSEDKPAALDCQRRTLAILEPTLGPEHALIGSVYANIGIDLANGGDFAGALEAHRRSLAIFEAAWGSQHPHVAVALTNVGQMLCMQSQCEQAIGLQRRALELNQAAFGPQHPSTGSAHHMLANTLRIVEAHHEALEHYERSLAIFEAVNGPEHHEALMTRLGIASSLRELEDYDGALAQIRPTVEVLERTQPGSYLHGVALFREGRTLLVRGDAVEASDVLARTLAIYESLTSGPEVAEVRFVLAQAVWESGDRARGRELLETARAEFEAAGEFGKLGLEPLEAWASTVGLGPG